MLLLLLLLLLLLTHVAVAAAAAAAAAAVRQALCGKHDDGRVLSVVFQVGEGRGGGATTLARISRTGRGAWGVVQRCSRWRWTAVKSFALR